MMKQFEKNQLKHAEIQENIEQIVQGETGSRKMTRKSKKQFENQAQAGYMQNNEPQIAGGEAGKKNRTKIHSQSGRSMIEMLGVLAIIAILSIGGIVGFRLAMNYYQANQIAHEMNIMRTDAQIKIAQGAEELTLGDPYDSGNIQFNGYKTDFDCLYMETETSEPELASCAVANAYYIEMQKIPEGICKPLANLIDKMDNEIAFYINGKSVDAAEGEKGACLGEENILTVIFGADSDSEAIKCNDDSDCPDNLPICHEHLCVECTEDGDCENPTPICNENTCVACGNDDECHLKNPSEENCVTGGACCKDPRMTWKDNECACPEDEPWNGEFCGCLTNNDCKSDEFCLTSECDTYECTNSEEVDQNPYYVGTITEDKACADKSHKCVKKSEYTAQNNDSNSPYVLSSQGMNWWSAKRFCEQHHKNMLKISDLDCCNNFSGTDHGYCYAKEDICSDANGLSHVIKALRKAETGDETQGNNAYWLEDPWGINPGSDSCAVYMIKLDMGYVSNNSRGNAHIDGGQRYVLCK